MLIDLPVLQELRIYNGVDEIELNTPSLKKLVISMMKRLTALTPMELTYYRVGSEHCFFSSCWNLALSDLNPTTFSCRNVTLTNELALELALCQSLKHVYIERCSFSEHLNIWGFLGTIGRKIRVLRLTGGGEK